MERRGGRDVAYEAFPLGRGRRGKRGALLMPGELPLPAPQTDALQHGADGRQVLQIVGRQRDVEGALQVGGEPSLDDR